MAGIGWNRLKMTDWMAMTGAVSALVSFFFLFLFKCLLSVSKDNFTIRTSVNKLLILRSCVDLLNYPFNCN